MSEISDMVKHKIMGVIDGDDFASYEKTLHIDTQALAKIMKWTKAENYFYDYELNKTQITALKTVCSIDLPQDLLFFLTSST